jgi:hypothetical protein
MTTDITIMSIMITTITGDSSLYLGRQTTIWGLLDPALEVVEGQFSVRGVYLGRQTTIWGTRHWNGSIIETSRIDHGHPHDPQIVVCPSK